MGCSRMVWLLKSGLNSEEGDRKEDVKVWGCGGAPQCHLWAKGQPGACTSYS